MKLKERALALMLSVMMVLTFMPTLAFAGEPEADENAQPVAAEEVSEEAVEEAVDQEAAEPEAALPQAPEEEVSEEAAPEEAPVQTRQETKAADGAKADGDDEECPHTNTQTWTDFDWDTVEYEPIGNDNEMHRVIGKIYAYTSCEDCGELLDKEFVEEDSDIGNHRYNEDGVCELCGHVNTCGHEDTHDYCEFDEITGYVSIDEKYHQVTGNGTRYTRCVDCGMIIKEEAVTDYTDKEWHDYEDGVCELCGHKNECQHEDTDVEYYFNEITGYDNIDDRYHLAKGTATVETYCNDCGTYISREEGVTRTEKQEHDYDENGVCVDCGHKNGCAHKNQDSWVSLEDITGYERLDDRNHYAIGSGTKYTYCEDCGMRLEAEDVTDYKDIESHEYDENGVCEYCGYENTCDHELTYSWYEFDGNATYESINDRDHRVTGNCTKFTECENCGMVISEEELTDYTRTEEHYYDENGFCEYCGHNNECKHDATYSYINFDDDAVYEKIDGKTHRVTGNGKRITYCYDCDMRVGEEEVVGQTEVENHEFNDGVCEYCGYKNDCDHLNTYSYIRFDDDAVYEEIDGRNHRVTGNGIEYTYCEDCGTDLDAVRVYDQTDIREHDFVGDTCEDCGYVSTCEHNNTYTWVSFDSEAVYTYLNSDYHNATGNGIKFTECEDCGKTLKRENVTNYTEKQWHDFDGNGKCEKCGYGCNHESTYKYFEFDDDATYASVDDQFHTITGSGTEYTMCNDCGETVKEQHVDSYTEQRQHDYNDEGICEACGHENACDHNKDYYTRFEYDWETVKVTVVDGNYHSITGSGTEYVYCSGCGELMSFNDVDNHTEKRTHYYDADGDCIECGYSKKSCAFGHSFSPWNTVAAATEVAAGKQTHTCSVCGKTEERAIAQLSPTLPKAKISKPAAAKKSATIKWKKLSAKNLKKVKKIEIQYSLDKNFKTGVITKYANAKKTSLKIKKLASKKTYYVRIRAYTKVGSTVHVSAWSARKPIKVK